MAKKPKKVNPKIDELMETFMELFERTRDHSSAATLTIAYYIKEKTIGVRKAIPKGK